MIEFRPTMDQHSLDLRREGEFVGDLQWHHHRSPRVILRDSYISIDEMKQCINKFNEIRGVDVAREVAKPMNNHLIIYFDGKVLTILDCGKAVQDTSKILDWYSDNYDFERSRLTSAWSSVIQVEDRLKADLGL